MNILSVSSKSNLWLFSCDEKNVEVVSDQDEILIMTQVDPDHHTDGAFTLRYIKGEDWEQLATWQPFSDRQRKRDKEKNNRLSLRLKSKLKSYSA